MLTAVPCVLSRKQRPPLHRRGGGHVDLGQILGRCSHKSRTPGPSRAGGGRKDRPPGFLTLPFRTGREVDFCGFETLLVWGTLLWQLQEPHTTSASQWRGTWGPPSLGGRLLSQSGALKYPAPLVKGQDAPWGATCLTCCRSCCRCPGTLSSRGPGRPARVSCLSAWQSPRVGTRLD